MRRAISRRHEGQALLMYFVVFGFGLGISEVAAHSRLVRSDPSHARSSIPRQRN
jgi:hypothetical protein